jgi:hypothetical protein
MDERHSRREPEVLLDPHAADALVLAARPERREEIVAVVLADGSVRRLRDLREPTAAGRRWCSGSLAGRDWIIWWERRRMGTVAS